MLIQVGSRFVFEVTGCGLYLKVPLVGEAWLGWDGQCSWDRCERR